MTRHGGWSVARQRAWRSLLAFTVVAGGGAVLIGEQASGADPSPEVTEPTGGSVEAPMEGPATTAAPAPGPPPPPVQEAEEALSPAPVEGRRNAAAADVSAVRGGAFGHSSRVSLFGGAATTVGPAPEVNLPAAGSSTPISASIQEGLAIHGPATILVSGPMTVTTRGTLGPTGSVTSTTDIQGVSTGPGPFLYQRVRSSCTASESGTTGTTTINGGVVETKLDRVTQEPVSTFTVPVNPAPNTSVTGTIDHVGDSFKIVFNEQSKAEDGTLTVTAAHMYLQGPLAVGDLFIGQVRCGVGVSAAATTTSSTTTAGSSSTTTNTTGSASTTSASGSASTTSGSTGSSDTSVAGTSTGSGSTSGAGSGSGAVAGTSSAQSGSGTRTRLASTGLDAPISLGLLLVGGGAALCWASRLRRPSTGGTRSP